MSDSEWRCRIRWVVLHPDRPRVLMLDEAGVMALPGVEVEGEVWTADAAVTATALRELLGFDALLLCSLEGHDDPEARVQRAALLAVPRGAAPLPRGARWVGREDLAAAPGPNEHAAVAARVLDELAGGRVRAGVAHRFVDPLTMFQAGEHREVDGPLRDRLLDAYLSVWTGFEPAERLLRAWRGSNRSVRCTTPSATTP